ncbi:metal/formaldehyde-sensitive transcriptional repressor [Thermomonas brevis]|uniref:Metal/formaldehyde-sensitive transcriptional repressor n=1 Tax=Thermomonas brevis TaxID=215691 RepID=A0A7G9QU48_9GAMM|nr:metal/formaldehyde-sensitive transcriptional repressor [Thermomonas brevis]QNN46873.1 metal/formaldehyde-sensitive transcriptional repressor [Thermomonas brevis]
MAHVIRDKKKLLARVRRIAGQVAALEKALDAETECTDILVQAAAAKGAMHALMMEVMSGHLAEHVAGESDEAKRQAEARRLIDLLRGYAR